MISQPMQALELANHIRYGRRDVKAEVRSGTLSLAAALEDERAAKMPVHKLLAALKRWGPTRAMSLLVEVGVSPLRHVSDLTDREREIIAEYAPLTPKERELVTYQRGLEKVLIEAQRRGWPAHVQGKAGVVVITALGEAMLSDLEDVSFLVAELAGA